MIKNKNNYLKTGELKNENFFKAIQSRMRSSKGSKSNHREHGTPKSNKK